MLRATFLLILPLMVLCGTVFAQGSMEVTTTVPATGSNLTV